MTKKPIINCHTHVFTGDHVPPHLGKSLMPLPAWWLLNFQWIFKAFRWWYRKGPGKSKYSGEANEKKERKYLLNMWVKRNYFVNTTVSLIGLFLTFQCVDILFHWFVGPADANPNWIMRQLYSLHSWCESKGIIWDITQRWQQVLLVLLVMIFFKSGRNLLIFLLKKFIKVLGQIPGKTVKALFERYLLIGRFAFHGTQAKTFDHLQNQYPEGSGFVLLPMDMAYMDAGKLKVDYYTQMQELADIKSSNPEVSFPFVFVDPRRIAEDANFFKYKVEQGKVVLEECFIKEFIELRKFSGFKIYPALGYYPFDPLLLPLWKYAEQHSLPIMTHCVRGPMYYRGEKIPAWDHHEIFKQKTASSGVYTPLLLNQVKNDQFSTNFTHPMNFLCLLKKEWLKQAVNIAYKKTKDDRLKAIFGFTPAEKNEDAVIQHDLANLKICLGHYGGNDEWEKYLEKDRYQYSNELMQTPDFGIDFLYLKGTSNLSPGKPEQLWRHCDWYSIISSMILQHDHVYADISYILHSDDAILPLLKQTLQNKDLRDKVLYGTDFYVVRNHKSDKHMLADMQGGLSEEDFDQVARTNPRNFLNLPS